MKKYRLGQLDIQVTRKCNLYCNHCICGDSQDMEIPFEAIDRILDCVEEIDSLFLTGGEPLLNIPAIKYIIDTVIRKKIAVRSLKLTTNGTIQNEEVVSIFRTASTEFANIYYSITGNYPPLNKMNTGFYIEFVISCDKWHDIKQSYEAFNYYLKEFEEDYITVGVLSRSDKTILFKGRAETIPHQTKNKIESSICRLRIGSSRDGNENYILCPLKLTAKGNIVNCCHDVVGTYAEEDYPDNIIGNIINESMESMIDCWQQEHMMTCIEEQKLNDCKTAVLNGTGTADQEAYIETLDQVLDIRKFYFDRMRELRDMPFDVFRAFMKDDGINRFINLDFESYRKLNKLISDTKWNNDKMSELNEYFRQYADSEVTQDEFISSVTDFTLKDNSNNKIEYIVDFFLDEIYKITKILIDIDKPEQKAENYNLWLCYVAFFKIESEKQFKQNIEKQYKDYILINR